ncbi:MAG: ABC transporter permease, partial [Gemmatimonadota bacterium]
LAAILVVGSGLAVRSLSRLQAINYGFAAQHMEIVTVRYPVGAYADLGERQAVATRIREELASLPAVADVSVSFVLPLAYSIRFGVPYLDGDQPTVVEEGAHSQSATSAEGFLATTGIPLLEGRDFTADERRDPSANRVVLVNRGFAARYPSSVVGRNLLFPNDTVGRLIVGVVGDVRTGNVTDRTVRPQIYYPSDGIGSTQRRTQRFLVRLAAILVVGSGLAVRSLSRLQAINYGFAAQHMEIVTVRYPDPLSSGGSLTDAGGKRRVWCGSVARGTPDTRDGHPHRPRRAPRACHPERCAPRHDPGDGGTRRRPGLRGRGRGVHLGHPVRGVAVGSGVVHHRGRGAAGGGGARRPRPGAAGGPRRSHPGAARGVGAGREWAPSGITREASTSPVEPDRTISPGFRHLSRQGISTGRNVPPRSSVFQRPPLATAA